MIQKYKVGYWYVLSVLTLVYVVGELSHFLLGIVTRPMSQDIHYGQQECLRNSKSNYTEDYPVRCYQTRSEELCSNLEIVDSANVSACVWDYSGLGYDYQILAGPAFTAVFTTSGIFIGILSDRYNRKWVLTICLAVLVIATILTGRATAYWHLVVLRMMIGAGESGFATSCSSMISDMFSPARRGMALGIFNWGIYFGYGLSYAIGNYATDANVNDMGWRFSFYISGAFGIVVFILLLLTVREPTRGGKTIEKWKEEGNDSRSLTDIRLQDSPVLKNIEEPKTKDEKSKKNEIRKTILNPIFIMLLVAACVRHTAGFSWAYNTQLYFSTYYPEVNLGLWIAACSIIGGTLGVVVGGFVSDRLVKRLGLKSRLYVLAASQLVATPFAVGVLTFPPPLSFYSLMGSYLFAEMWFGVLYAVLLEIIPSKVKATTLAIFLFVMNNIGGNAPILVEPIRNVSSYRTALYILYPGNYLLSSVLFFLTTFFVKSNKTLIISTTPKLSK